jgi:hypothetical protein
MVIVLMIFEMKYNRVQKYDKIRHRQIGGGGNGKNSNILNLTTGNSAKEGKGKHTERRLFSYIPIINIMEENLKKPYPHSKTSKGGKENA